MDSYNSKTEQLQLENNDENQKIIEDNINHLQQSSSLQQQIDLANYNQTATTINNKLEKNNIQNENKYQQHQGKNPSWKSWIAISNTMMGSSIVVFPTIFKENGIITSFIVMFVVGAFMCTTCLWSVRYCLPEERDLYDAIERLLGRKWKIFYSIANSCLLYLVQIIYFILLTSFCFPCLKLMISDGFGLDIAQLKEYSFSKFSYQWTGICLSIIAFLLLMIRDLTYILKITQFGLISIGSIIAFAFVKFGKNAQEGINFDDTPLFTPKIHSLIGIFILSFQIHTLIIPILRDNKDQTKNENNTLISYILTLIVYALVSLFGVLAVAGKKPIEGNPGNTILEYFEDNDVFSVIVRIGLCIYIVGIYPIIVYGSRNNFFQVILAKNQAPPTWLYHLANLFCCGSALIVFLTELDLKIVMSVAGYFVSFFIAVVFPLLMRIKGRIYEKQQQNLGKVRISHNQILPQNIQMNDKNTLESHNEVQVGKVDLIQVEKEIT